MKSLLRVDIWRYLRKNVLCHLRIVDNILYHTTHDHNNLQLKMLVDFSPAFDTLPDDIYPLSRHKEISVTHE